jgi:hypothetical protein
MRELVLYSGGQSEFFEEKVRPAKLFGGEPVRAGTRKRHNCREEF